MSTLSAALSFTPNQVRDDPDRIRQACDAPTMAVLEEAERYLSQILTRPDTALGRLGAICPFVGSALRGGMISFTVLPMRGAEAGQLRRVARALAAEFDLAGQAVSRLESLRAVVILMPHLDAAIAAPLIERVQKELKPAMVEAGLMVGEFFPGCSLPGLHNAAFRPADTSFCCLAIRRMNAADLPFLVEDERFLSLYLTRFGDEGYRRLDAMRAPSRLLPGGIEVDVAAQAALQAPLAMAAFQAG